MNAQARHALPRFLAALLLLLPLAACGSLGTPDGVDVRTVTSRKAPTGPRVLCVIAHPDDETTFAGTLYKVTSYLDGACDVVVLTNGEGGFKYSTLSEDYYGLELTEESVGRAHLPRIRKREFLDGCELMQVRRAYFLNETDHRYTQDAEEVLAEDAGVWDLARVRRVLQRVLEAGAYDFVFTMAPVPGTHGHHKAATILALEAVAGMEDEGRPVILCARTSSAGAPNASFTELEGYPETRIASAAPELRFDRTQSFGHRGRLSYKILVNLVIAAHRSQGTMQLAMSRGDYEDYSLFAVSPAGGADRAAALFEALRGEQFVPKQYGESAGTNAGAVR